MQFEKLVDEYKKLDLPPDEFAVTSSGSMAARGIREAKDLDLVISEKLFGELSKSYKVIPLEFDSVIRLNDNIEAMGKFVQPPSSEEQIRTADVIDGIRFVNLDYIKITKKRMGREKDLRDIELIDEYLEKYT